VAELTDRGASHDAGGPAGRADERHALVRSAATERDAPMRVRPHRGAADGPPLAAVRRAAAAVDQVDRRSTLEPLPDAADVAAALADLPPGDAVVVETNGRPVGYSTVSSWVESDGLRVYLHREYAEPAARPRAWELLVDWAEERTRLLAARRAGERWCFGTSASETETGLTALLIARGYQPAFTMVEMQRADPRPPPEAPVPPGYEVRPADPAHFRAIWQASWDAYAGRPFMEAQTEEDFEAFSTDPRNDPTLWPVAWHGGAVAGQVDGTVAGSVGVVTEVSVVPAHRRRGLARALLTRALGALLARGVDTVRLQVRAGNAPAVELYESLGFRSLKEHVRYRKPGRP
jgi:mycothiol synthase